MFKSRTVVNRKIHVLHTLLVQHSVAMKQFITVFIQLAPVVQKVDNAIHQINYYTVDSAIGFPNTYPLDSDLSGG